MGAYVADAAIKKMIEAGQKHRRKQSGNSWFGVLKRIVIKSDHFTRNSKVDDIIKELKEYGIQPAVVDPLRQWASERDAMRGDGVVLTKLEDIVI